MTKYDYWHHTIKFMGRMRNVVDVRPLDNYGREMDEPAKCSVCGMHNGNHALQKHRLASLTGKDRSMANHPAGKRRPSNPEPKDDGNDGSGS